MTSGLPRGLISVQNNPTHVEDDEEDAETARLDVASIARTWRVYSASSNVLAADTGNRLQNLFWRTWSNPHLLRNLRPTTFTNVVQYVGTGRGRVQLPLPSHIETNLEARDEDDSTPVPSGPPTATASPVQTSSTAANSSISPTDGRQRSSSLMKPPQSILKRPSIDRNYVEPCASDVPPSIPPPSPRNTAGSSSSADTLSPTSSDRPRIKRQTSGGNKKTSFVANTSARAKTRPAVARRKSSQGTMPQAKDPRKEPTRSPMKSPVKSPLHASSGNEGFPQLPAINQPRRAPVGPPPGLPLPPGLSDPKNAAFLLPSASSWQSVESTSPGRSGQGPFTQSSMPLVDPDFRKQFVEARSSSQLNLAAAGGSRMRKTGSVVRFADDLPAEFRRSKAREASISGLGAVALRRGSVLDAARTQLSAETAAIDDSDEEEDGDDKDTLVMLPRTRSQLSLAIHQQRRISGPQNLGPVAGGVPDRLKGKGKGKANDTDKEDTEDELLAMGRKDGVTKAGGPRSRLPLRATPSSEQRYRSPTPPPIF
jgi:hypothetical protein